MLLGVMVLLGVYMCCYAIAMMFLCVCYRVARWLLWFC